VHILYRGTEAAAHYNNKTQENKTVSNLKFAVKCTKSLTLLKAAAETVCRSEAGRLFQTFGLSTTKTEDTEVRADYRQLSHARLKPDTVNQPARTACTFVYHYKSTRYCSTETVLLIFPFFQTNISAPIRPSGSKGCHVQD